MPTYPIALEFFFAMAVSTANLICDLARQFYDLGWVTGTGGGICIREGDEVLVAPSGVQKERMTPDQMFALGLDGTVLRRPIPPCARPSALRCSWPPSAFAMPERLSTRIPSTPR
jgi:hypothetical protein